MSVVEVERGVRVWTSRCYGRDDVRIGCLSPSLTECTWGRIVWPQRTARLSRPWQAGIRVFGWHVWVQW